MMSDSVHVADTILVVDDEDANRRIATLFLQRQGYQVVDARDAASAWEAMQSHEYRLILLDISMPGESGLDLCRRIRANYQGRQPAVVAYTAHAMAMEQSEILAAGFDDIVTKPISKQVLLDKVAQALATRAG